MGEAVHEAARFDNVEAFLSNVEESIEQHNFKVVLNDLSNQLFGEEADPQESLQFLLHCLLSLQAPHRSSSAAVKHLVLELLPRRVATEASEHVRRQAVQLFESYCSRWQQDAKLAAKVATTFNLHYSDVSHCWEAVTAAVQGMLQEQQSYKAAVHLLMHFEELGDQVNKLEVLTQLVADGQDSLAQQWVSSLGKDFQVMFVEVCVALDRLKPAARAVRQLRLAAEFPAVEGLYRQRSLARLVGKRLWQVALSFVGNDVVLQTQLVQDMAAAGELLLAQEYRQQLGLPESILLVDPAQLAEQEAARASQYLQLPLPPESLILVDDAAGLAAAAAALERSDVLGLDVEWKPAHTAGEASPAALLQVASRETAVLFDLITLAQQQPGALDACLGPLLNNPGILKLGFEVSGDLTKLSSSWPGVAAFRTVSPVLDLKPLWIAHGLATRTQGASVRLLSAVGLSSLCKALLGKPLDKAQQMSDWSARPLSQRQLVYAALDAVCLPRLYDRLADSLGPERCQQLVKQHSFTYRRPLQQPDRPAGPTAAAADEADALVTATAASGGESTAAAMAAVAVPAAGRGDPSASSAAPAPAATADSAGMSSSGMCGAAHQGEQQLQQLLEQVGLSASFRRLGTPAAAGPGGQGSVSASATAIVLGVPASLVAKSTLVCVKQQPLLVVTPGDARVDLHKLAALWGVRRRAVKIAPDSLANSGGVPPIGVNVPVVIDHRLAGGGGGGSSGPTMLAACSSRGGGVVAAVAAMQQPSPPSASGTRPSSSSSGSAGAAACAPRLYVQCGRTGVLELSFDQLLQASHGSVGDVAESAGPPAPSPPPAAAGLGSGGQPVPPLLLDSMLGRLCRWLRVLGVDAEFVDSPPSRGQQQQQQQQQQGLEQQQSVLAGLERQQRRAAESQQQQQVLVELILRAAGEGRLFLTRDAKLAARRDVGGGVFLLASDEPAQQLAEISSHFGIQFDEAAAMSRCSNCNAADFRLIPREDAAPLVPPHVLEIVDEFWRCGSCNKVFWMGPKSYAALNLLNGLFQDGRAKATPLPSSRPKQPQPSSGEAAAAD